MFYCRIVDKFTYNEADDIKDKKDKFKRYVLKKCWMCFCFVTLLLVGSRCRYTKYRLTVELLALQLFLMLLPFSCSKIFAKFVEKLFDASKNDGMASAASLYRWSNLRFL